MTDCRTLLAAYATQGSEAAFRELVTRYLGLVYSSALRLVGGDTQLAEDVAQTVFIHLARHAGRFSGDLHLGGWLHRDTCNVALKLIRGERRRRVRERQAAEMNALEKPGDSPLAEVAPLLDEAIDRLGEQERTAVILRFFEQYDFGAVGKALGTSEDAARMRVNRALDKLHGLLKHRGVSLSAAALGTALTANAVSAAPPALAVGIATTALASAAAGGAALTTFKLITMTNIKIAALSAVLVGSVATPLVVQHQSIAKLRQQNDSLQQQADQSAQLVAENERLSNLVLQASQPLPDNQQRELLRLRGEVGQLRSQLKDLEAARKDNLQLRASLARPGEGIRNEEAEQKRNAEAIEMTSITKMNDAKRLMLGLLLHEDDSTNQVVISLDQLQPYLGTNSLTGTNQFELVYNGLLRDVKNPAQTIVIREGQAWQGPDAGVFRTYGFADGHCEIHKAENGSFEDWERAHMASSLPLTAH